MVSMAGVFKRLGLFLSQQELTSRSSHRFSNVPAIPTCHSWAQGRGKKGRRHSGAGGMVAAGERCSWPRPVLSFPQKAVGGWWIVLTLLGVGSAWPESGIRLLSRGRPSSSSARLHCASVLCTSLRQCFGGGCGGQEYGAKDPRVFGGGGGGVGGGL